MLRAELQAVNTSLASLLQSVEQQTKSIDKSKEAENRRHDQNNESIKTVIAIQHLPADEQKTQQKHRNRELGIQGWTALATTLAFAAAAYYAHIAHRQLCEMRAANYASERHFTETINRIDTQNTLMREQLEGTQAAVLRIITNFFPDQSRLEVDAMNIGHMTAFDIDETIKISKVAVPNGNTIGSPIEARIKIPEIAVTSDRYDQREYPLHISPPEMALLKDTRLTIKLEGTVTYNNGFGIKTHPICYEFLTYTYRDEAGTLKQSGGNAVPCDEYAIVLRSILRDKAIAKEK